jgi:hypothetical protein
LWTTAFSKLNCLPTKTVKNENHSAMECKGKNYKEKCDFDFNDKKGSESVDNQDISNSKVNIQLKFKDDDDQAQEVCSGTVFDAEVDQDTDSIDAIDHISLYNFCLYIPLQSDFHF